MATIPANAYSVRCTIPRDFYTALLRGGGRGGGEEGQDGSALRRGEATPRQTVRQMRIGVLPIHDAIHLDAAVQHPELLVGGEPFGAPGIAGRIAQDAGDGTGLVIPGQDLHLCPAPCGDCVLLPGQHLGLHPVDMRSCHAGIAYLEVRAVKAPD